MHETTWKKKKNRTKVPETFSDRTVAASNEPVKRATTPLEVTLAWLTPRSSDISDTHASLKNVNDMVTEGFDAAAEDALKQQLAHPPSQANSTTYGMMLETTAPELDSNGNSPGIVTDNLGNYLGYHSIPKCHPVIFQHQLLGFSTITDANDPTNGITTSIATRAQCQSYQNAMDASNLLLGGGQGQIQIQYIQSGNETKAYNTTLGGMGDPNSSLNNMDLSQNIHAVVKYTIEAVNKGIYYASYPLIYTQKVIQNFSGMVTDTFSGVGFYERVAPSDLDRLCVYVTIQNIIWYFICIWIFFNWYYLICYRENGHPVKTYDISWVWLKEHNIFLSLFFKYVVCQVSFINAVMMFFQRYANFVLGPVWGPKINAMILFVLIVLLVIYADMTTKIMNLFFQSLAANIPNWLVALLIGMALVFALYTFLLEDWIVLALKFGTIILGIFTIVLFILRILWSVLIIWVASLLIALYFIVYSLFAMAIYSRTSVFQTIRQMTEYMSAGFEPPSPFKYSVCRPRTWGEWLIELLKAIVSFLIQYLFEIILIFMLIYNIYVYVMLLGDNANLQNAMIVITVFIVLGVLGFMYRKLFPVSSRAPTDEIHEVQRAMGVFSTSDLARETSTTLFPTFKGLSAKLTNLFIPTREEEAARQQRKQAQAGGPTQAPAPAPAPGARPGPGNPPNVIGGVPTNGLV